VNVRELLLRPLRPSLLAHAAYVSPTSRATGDIVTAAIWNQDIVQNMLAQPAELAEAAGDLFVGLDLHELQRLAMGSALQFLRVNAGATGLEWAASPAGWEPVATGTWTGTSVTISGLSGFLRYWALVQYRHADLGGGALSLSPSWKINALSAEYQVTYTDKVLGATTTTDGFEGAASSIAAGGGASADDDWDGLYSLLVTRPSVSGPMTFLGQSMIVSGSAGRHRSFAGAYSGAASDITSIAFTAASLFQAIAGSHYVVLGSRN
jgi:hypothetical protein